MLTQAFARFPGLLPCLLLLLPFVLPLIVLGLLGAVLFGVPYGIWKLINTVTRPLRSHRGDTGQLVQPGRTSPDSYA